MLARGTYELEIPGDFPGDGGDLEPSTPMELRGEGASETKIDANGIDRPISIGCGISTTGAVRIEGLTLKGGDPGANPFNCTFNDRSLGGGILTFGQALKLEGVIVKGNEAELGGGVESVAGKLTIKDSTIAKNNASEGGGVHLSSRSPGLGPPSVAATVIRSSTISGNLAAKGGGILADGAVTAGTDPSVELLNSTVAGNMASDDGGGIMGDNDAMVTLDNSTVAYNQANSDNVEHRGRGRHLPTQRRGLRPRRHADRREQPWAGRDGEQCAGSFAGTGGIVVEFQERHRCSISGTLSEPNDALIGPLADNGGPTKTVKLLSGSAPSDRGDLPETGPARQAQAGRGLRRRGRSSARGPDQANPA